MSSGFDRLARPYRWLEYITFGKALERCRFCLLGDLRRTENALLLGDGDGRFTVQLLHSAPTVRAHAVDSSVAMLHALQRRCSTAGYGDRTHIYPAELPAGLDKVAAGTTFDLVATHFFLDCLSQEDVGRLVPAVTARLRPGSQWVISEFNIPSGMLHAPARILVRGLYLAFRVLAGLRATRLPDHASILRQHGFRPVKQVPSLGGILQSELWVWGGSSSGNAHGLESKQR